MVAFWNPLRPKADSNKKLTETPIPSNLLSAVLPLWESVSDKLTSAKKEIDDVSTVVSKKAGTSLAAAGANSAALRVGKVLKVAKVRDLDKTKNALEAATTKVNLAWAGLEMIKFEDSHLYVVKAKAVSELLKLVEEELEEIQRLLKPDTSPEGLKAAAVAVAKGKRQALEREKASAQGSSMPSSDSRSTRPRSREVAPTTNDERTTKGSLVAGADASAKAGAGAGVSSYLAAGKAVVKLRKLRDDAALLVDAERQAEFGEDPLAVLKAGRERPVGEGVLELGDYFKLKAEQRKGAGGFVKELKSSQELVGLMLMKPKSAGAPGMPLSLKAGSKWGSLKSGVKGDKTFPEVPSSLLPAADQKPSTPTTKAQTPPPGITEQRSILRSASTMLGKVAGGAGLAGEGRGRSREKSSEGQVVTRMERSISFDGEMSASSDREGIVGARQRAKSAEQVEAEFVKLEHDFAKELTSRTSEKIDMDKFRQAFHESSRMEEVDEHKEMPGSSSAASSKPQTPPSAGAKKKGLLGGFGLGGAMKALTPSAVSAAVGAVASRATMIGAAASAAARAVTPESLRNVSPFSKKPTTPEKKRVAMEPDHVVVARAIDYWKKQLVDKDDEMETGKNGEKKKKMLKPHLHNRTEWAELNIGLAKFCDPSKEAEALAHLEKALKSFPTDPTPHLRIGQIKSASRSNVARNAGLELLRKTHGMVSEAEAAPPYSNYGGLLDETTANFGAAAYENSELKNATACYDYLLSNAKYYATDEAICTKAQIMLRRGQFAEAVPYYSNLARADFKIEDLRLNNNSQSGGLQATIVSKKGAKKKKDQAYVYPHHPSECGVNGDLLWTKAPRRRETLMGAADAYKSDPRHLSR